MRNINLGLIKNKLEILVPETKKYHFSYRVVNEAILIGSTDKKLNYYEEEIDIENKSDSQILNELAKKINKLIQLYELS